MTIRNWALAALIACAPPAAAEAKTVVVTAGRMVDVAAGRVVERPVVVVAEGKVSAVGVQGQLQLPEADERVDLPGHTLLPGLIDMHVHLDASPLYAGYSSLQFTDSFWAIVAVRHARDTLMAGFTTVRNVGADRFNDVGLKQAVEEGAVIGPRIVPAGYAIGATGGHCDSNAFPPSMEEKGPAVADGADEMRRRVRWMHKYGAEVIKLCATGGVFSHRTSPGAQQLTYEELKAAVEEAHRLGMKVAAHAHGAAGIRDAIRAGVDTIEHASLVDDEGVRLAVAAGTWFSMDIYNTDYTQSEGKRNGVLEENLKKDRDIAQAQRDNFRKAFRAGVRMVYGTDAGVYPHGDNAKQFKLMVEYGMTPMQAIQSATLRAAEALGMAGEVGTISVGGQADLIAVPGDPLQDVTALERVDFVMKGGDVFRWDSR